MSCTLQWDGTLVASATVTPQAVRERIGRAEQALGLSFPISISVGSGGNSVALDGSLALDSDIGLKLDFDLPSFSSTNSA